MGRKGLGMVGRGRRKERDGVGREEKGKVVTRRGGMVFEGSQRKGREGRERRGRVRLKCLSRAPEFLVPPLMAAPFLSSMVAITFPAT